MTQIAKIESGITQNRNSFASALTAKPIKSSSDFEIAEAISSAIEKAAFDLGLRQMADGDLNLLKFGILSEVKNSFTTLTIDEVKNAFHFGVRGKYGEVFGLNVAQAAKWMSSYMTDQLRVEARKQLAKAIDTKTEPGPDEKFNTAKNLCLEAYELVKAAKPIGILAVTVYTFIKSLGLLDGYKGDLKEAISALISEKEKDIAFCMDLQKRRQLNNDLEKLKEGNLNDMLTPEQWDEVKRMGKRMVITNYLQDVSLEDNLVELIEGKRDFYKSNSNTK